MSSLDWQKSDPHQLFLSKFLSPKSKNDFDEIGNWRIVLGESPQQTINRFINEGLLTNGDIEDKLDYRFKTTELKNLLKKKGLQTSGKKADYIQRLIESNPEEMHRIAKGIDVFSCTDKGREIVAQYLEIEKERRDKVDNDVIEYLRQRKFKDASITIATFEVQRVFPRGLGIDWKRHNPARDIEVLSNIFGSKPKILSNLNDNQMEGLRIAAGMMFLWGTNHAKEWLPSTYETGLYMDNDTAARMFSFYALHKANIANYRLNSDVVTGVTILATKTSCDACKLISGKEFTLDNVLELPYENCTSEKGCRCAIAPIVMRPPNVNLQAAS